MAVRAAGINFTDLMARSGIYPDAPPLPSVVGYEVARRSRRLGGGRRARSGDRVIAGTRFRGCTPSFLVAVDQGQVLPLPDRMSYTEQGAALVVNYATAYAGLVVMGGLRAGERMLIQAAAGGVGIAAIQVARTSARRSSGRHPPASTR